MGKTIYPLPPNTRLPVAYDQDLSLHFYRAMMEHELVVIATGEKEHNLLWHLTRAKWYKSVAIFVAVVLLPFIASFFVSIPPSIADEVPSHGCIF